MLELRETLVRIINLINGHNELHSLHNRTHAALLNRIEALEEKVNSTREDKNTQ